MESISTREKCFILANDSDDDDDFPQVLATSHRTGNCSLSQSSEGGATLCETSSVHTSPQDGAKQSAPCAKPFSKSFALEVQDILHFQRKVGSAKIKEQIVSSLAAVGGAYAPLCSGSSFAVWSRYTELSARALNETKLLLDKMNASMSYLHCQSEQVKPTCVRSGQKVGFRDPLPSKSRPKLSEPKNETPLLLSAAELLALSVLTQTESDASLQSNAYAVPKIPAHSSPNMLLDIYDEDIDVFFTNETPTKLMCSANKRPREDSTEAEASGVSSTRCSLSAAVLHRQNEHTRVNWMTN